MDNTCGICNKKLTFLTGKLKISSGELICNKCFESAGMKHLNKIAREKITLTELKEKIDKSKTNDTIFEATYKAGTKIWFDDNNALLKTNFSEFGIKPNTIVPYKNIIDMHIIEDDKTITKSGAGGAIGGALLFGPTGAIVGGLFSRGKKKKDIIEKLHIILIDVDGAARTIFLINSKTKKNSFVYKATYEEFLKAGTKFEEIIDNNKSRSTKHENDFKQELLDLKELLDLGVITQQEFDNKKIEILRK